MRYAAADSPLCDDANVGLQGLRGAGGAFGVGELHWAAHRADVSPEEVALAALLGEMGELMLWAFFPELPQRALEELKSGRATRNVQAQQQVAGFSFKQPSVSLIETLGLPPLIMQLVKGADTPRANIARIASG